MIVPRNQDGAVGEAEFMSAMRQVASSVAIVTARLGHLCNGLAATAVCCVSASPPTMLVCVNRRASADPLIDESGAFAINFLAESQHAIARLFSTAKLTPQERFSEGGWIALATGSPILSDAVAGFDCRIESRIGAGTHRIYLGRVVGVTSLEHDVLLYRDGAFRRLQPGN